MKKLPLVALSLAAAATLAACGGRTYEASVRPAVVPVSPTVVYAYPTGAVATYVQPSNMMVESVTILRPGFGRVESIQQVVNYSGAFTGYRRLTLRMDDNTIQVLDTRGPELALGSRVEITTDRSIRYPIG